LPWSTWAMIAMLRRSMEGRFSLCSFGALQYHGDCYSGKRPASLGQ